MEFKVEYSKQQQLMTYLKSWTPEPPVCLCVRLKKTLLVKYGKDQRAGSRHRTNNVYKMLRPLRGNTALLTLVH